MDLSKNYHGHNMANANRYHRMPVPAAGEAGQCQDPTRWRSQTLAALHSTEYPKVHCAANTFQCTNQWLNPGGWKGEGWSTEHTKAARGQDDAKYSENDDLDEDINDKYCTTRRSVSINWVVLSSLFVVRCSSRMVTSPFYDVLDHTSHIFSESLLWCWQWPRGRLRRI